MGTNLNLPTDRVESILFDLGVSATHVTGSEVYALCPGHLSRTGKIDGKPSWSINADNGLHSCWSCGYRGSIVGLVVDQLGLTTNVFGTLVPDWDGAEAWLATRTLMSVEEMKERLERLQQVQEFRAPVPISEARLLFYDDVPYSALEERDLQDEYVREYGVRFDTGNDHWIIPIRHPDTNVLLGWQEKGHGNRHFKNFPAGVPKSLTLFGSWLGVPMLKSTIVVESPLDAVRLTGLGYHGVSTYGVRVSDEQISLLCAYDDLVIALDNDRDGVAVARDLSQRKEFLRRRTRFFNYGDTHKKDVGDMTDDQIIAGVDTARGIVLGRKAVADADF